MRTNPIGGRPSTVLRSTCTCRRCRARSVRQQSRVVESTLVRVRQRPVTADWKKRSRWLQASVCLLLLVLLLLTGMGTFWDLGPLAPLLFRPTAIVTIVPTRVDRQATLVMTAVTSTPDAARQEVAARFVSATSPVSKASGRALGVEHVPATAAYGT